MTPQPTEQPRTALREFVEEASFGPWRRETGVAPSEEEHMVWLTNEAGDSLLVNADDVAMLVNAAIVASAPDPVASPAEAVALMRELIEAGDNVIPTAGMSEPGDGDWRRFSEATHEARRYLAATEETP